MTPAVNLAARQFRRRGYAQLDRVFPASVTRHLIHSLGTLRRRGFPPVYLALLDEFWRLPRRQPVLQFLHDVLGRRVYQSPNVWVHVVEAGEESPGWPPHRDHTRGDRVTMWIPLTRALVEDGCISVLPPHLVPRRLSGLWRGINRFSRAEVLQLLHAARPLPVQAGAVLCWRTNVLHWGGRRTRTGAPRIACSMEFSPRPIPRKEIGLPSIPIDGPLPTFEQRIDLVRRMAVLYDR